MGKQRYLCAQFYYFFWSIPQIFSRAVRGGYIYRNQSQLMRVSSAIALKTQCLSCLLHLSLSSSFWIQNKIASTRSYPNLTNARLKPTHASYAHVLGRLTYWNILQARPISLFMHSHGIHLCCSYQSFLFDALARVLACSRYPGGELCSRILDSEDYSSIKVPGPG